ncbi:MAG: GGDEF domain-containing protein [Betaproteobacteria bacterium HGW-Betaproteobacteria-14]|nr:MAG: GGDEF domain-containing protein [Betaproteobacteria bacterium HGW-Betaproteobacteria-14]
MAEITQPSEIAREALRRLASRRTPPTPDNYRTLYHEIAGTTGSEEFPERALKALCGRLPRATPEQARFGQQFDSAIAAKDWTALTSAMTTLLKSLEVAPLDWSKLIGELLAQMERRHAGQTAAKKRETVTHILDSAGGDPANLYERLISVLQSWSKSASVDPPVPAGPAVPDAGAISASTPTEAPLPNQELRELIAQLVESSMSMLLIDTPALAEEAAALAAGVRSVRDAAAFAPLSRQLKQFCYRLNFVAEDQAELKAALQKLLQLVIENISELVEDDKWVQGQIGMVLDLFGQPLNLRRLDDVGQRLKEVIYRQSALKKNLNEAKERLKVMLAGFVDHLASFSESTSEYHDKIGQCAEKISAANDLAELNDIIEVIVRETRVIQLNAERSRDELNSMKARVDEAEQEVVRLQNELAETSEMVRHDQLTGALNRRGLEETLDRELARTGRRRSPLCIALLDVDNFKALNDTHGHQTGDDALIHLARVIRETIRPHDTLARFGGEEFLIILPDTPLADAVAAVTRLQRELTKRFFLHKNERLLITFSAGVTAFRDEESRNETIARADAAMYQAKKAGKNRVVSAD